MINGQAKSQRPTCEETGRKDGETPWTRLCAVSVERGRGGSSEISTGGELSADSAPLEARVRTVRTAFEDRGSPTVRRIRSRGRVWWSAVGEKNWP